MFFIYFNWSHFRTLLSVTNLNIFALGGNAQNRIKCKKKSIVMIMLPHCAGIFFNNNNKIIIFIFKCAKDYAAPCQWWHACLGLPTVAPGQCTSQCAAPVWLWLTDSHYKYRCKFSFSFTFWRIIFNPLFTSYAYLYTFVYIVPWCVYIYFMFYPYIALFIRTLTEYDPLGQVILVKEILTSMNFHLVE